ncbi:MAG: PqqD family protein [Acidobacteriota bacterium]
MRPARTTPVPLDARVTVPGDVVFRELDGEAVVLQVETGRYFGLDPVATRMWTALNDSGTVGGALEILFAEYDTTRQRLRHDLERLLLALAERRLIRLEEARSR